MKIDISKLIDVGIPDKPLKEYSGKELSVAALSALALTGITISLIAAPNLSKLFKHFSAETRPERWRIYQKLKRLEQEGFIEKIGRYYQPTQKGHSMLAKKLLRIKRVHTQKWDGVWHMVLFDLPAKHLGARTDLRKLLNELGYIKYQNSVYVHRYDLKEIIVQFCALYGVRNYINFVTATHFDNDTWLTSITKRQ